MRSPVSLRTPLQGTFMGSSAYTRARFGPVVLWHPAARCCFFPSFSILSQLSKDYWCLCVWQRVFGSYHFFGEGVVGFGHLHCLPLIRLQLIYTVACPSSLSKHLLLQLKRSKSRSHGSEILLRTRASVALFGTNAAAAAVGKKICG